MVANGLLFLDLMVTSHCILPYFICMLTFCEYLICDSQDIILVSLARFNGCFDGEKSYSYSFWVLHIKEVLLTLSLFIWSFYALLCALDGGLDMDFLWWNDFLCVVGPGCVDAGFLENEMLVCLGNEGQCVFFLDDLSQD